ncbi:LLM class flavin-dependent oxidoreductase [Pseudooceanicola aestuarii]|uniref:LLM class flavin-dependent oxidoreductase n=1 Tax=Pseudooceanicola aestuarii TaxID=2697319 RepID=UPI0013D4C438|nr:LLM class flavin-dependent oxidoreductase [Pseudooceanicola aestuarii]
MHYSLLDLAPIPEGQTTADALRHSVRLARAAEAAGYHRHWLAEHHNMPGIASSATAVVIGHVAAATSRIRVGAGGIMLPNHAPLMVAEQFGTLAELHPDRIDLGLGRAPGTDMDTARALRRNMAAGDTFPQDVMELQAYLGPATPDQRIRAVPGTGTQVPLWILGSSLYGAQLAAHLGLPYAFASHFAPAALDQAAEVYRQTFRPSAQLEAPYFMLAANVFGADTEAKARYLRSSVQQAFVRLRTGQPGPLPRPVERIEDHVPPHYLSAVEEALSVTAMGTPEQVQAGLKTLIDRYQPDELILASQVHDIDARIESFEIAARAMQALGGTAA